MIYIYYACVFMCVSKYDLSLSAWRWQAPPPPTSTEGTPPGWRCRPGQRAVACWDGPGPRRAGPPGPPQGTGSGPDWSGTWGERTQETSAAIISSSPLQAKRVATETAVRISVKKKRISALNYFPLFLFVMFVLIVAMFHHNVPKARRQFFTSGFAT